MAPCDSALVLGSDHLSDFKGIFLTSVGVGSHPSNVIVCAASLDQLLPSKVESLAGQGEPPECRIISLPYLLEAKSSF
jgi:hypothetical protein